MSENRKVGENLDEKTAADIFDKLKNVEGKIKPKKEDSPFKNIANLMNEAKYLEEKGDLSQAIDLYKQVIFSLPDSVKAYEALVNIYKNKAMKPVKRDFKKAVSNCKYNNQFKKDCKNLIRICV